MLRVLHRRIDWSWIVNKVWCFIKLSNKHIQSQQVYFKGESKKLKKEKKSNERKKKKESKKRMSILSSIKDKS